MIRLALILLGTLLTFDVIAETIRTSIGDLKLTDKTVAKGSLVGKRTEKPGKHYRRIQIELFNKGESGVRIEEFELLKDYTPRGEGERIGYTDGAVAVFPAAKTFIGVENPLAKVTVENGKVTAILERGFEIKPGEKWVVTYVIGSYREGQLRRDFHEYLNRERAHPYRVLPHYNSWYDINIGRNDRPWQDRMNEIEALTVMMEFRKELSKRGVFINSYLWDDGWDDWNSLWDFHPGFPNGFKRLAAEAHRNEGASIGAWMSPCGGYGGSQAARIRYAKSKSILGPNENQMRLSSPAYYAAFRDRVIKMIKDYDMNLFKFDRMGRGVDCEGAGKEHAPDMDAIVRLIGEMRAAKEDVFINATVGTWASPFWVMYADSIWRGGGDFGMAGEGRARQKWLTYRDNVIHDRFVTRSPLFPLNSIMMHGIIVNRGGPPTVMDISNSANSTQDFADEVWMGVACGTGLQEYYITPKLMHPEWWDILANGIKWIKKNERVLRDVHWVGGDPCFGAAAAENAVPAGNVYGYASFFGNKKGAKGIVILRNPSQNAQTFKTSLKELFELDGLPRQNAKVLDIKTTYSHDAKVPEIKTAAEEMTFEFGPFGIALIEYRL